jgi:hypothetical protein
LIVYQINQALAPMRTIAAIAIICGTIVMVQVSRAWPGDSSRAISREFQAQLAAEPASPVAQDDSDDDDKDVPTSQVDKYINVYEAMQKDHNLTVEQAASKEGLTVAQFRSLEEKIERDDTLRERVRKALRHAANPNEKDTSDQ